MRPDFSKRRAIPVEFDIEQMQNADADDRVCAGILEDDRRP